MKKFNLTFITLFIGAMSLAFAHSASALTVSPAILEVSGDAGTTLSGTIKLFNEKNTTQTFYTSFENFEPSDDSGTPKFVGADDGLATWMSATGSVTLAAEERVEVPFTISIPSDTDAGGYFAAIFFGTQPPANEGGTVSIGGRLGVLTLLRVNGDIPEDGGLLEYDTKDSQYFYNMLPVEFEYRFSNDGGDRVIPRGDIEIKNTFGAVRDTINANPTEGSVLPDSARRFSPRWDVSENQPQGFLQTVKYQWNNFHFGFYKAQLQLGWGFTNQRADDVVSFFIFPWQLLLTLVIGFIVLLALFKFGGKAYKESLMKQLQAQQEKIKEEDASASETTI